MSVVTYYDLPYSRDTKITPRQRYQFDTMSDGTVSGRDVAGGEVYDATIVHNLIQQADVDGLLQHYADHKNDTVQFQHAGRAYNLHYTAEPEIRKINGTWHDATVTMVGVRV